MRLQLVLVSLFAVPLAGQATLSTTFANNNGGSVGGGVYFDLDVTSPGGITISALDLNVTGSGSIDVYLLPGGRGTSQTNQAAWTLAGSGAVAGLGAGQPSPVAISPIVLPPGLVGVALAGVGVSHAYTNGNGTNQTYSNPDLTLMAGEASNTAFVGSLFTPRVVNTNIYYTLNGGSGTFAVNTTLGQGCLLAYASAYELFATAAAFDLTGVSITMVPSAGGYVLVPTGAFVPSGSISAPTALALTDDSQVNVPLTAMGSFPTGTGSVTSLTVCSNGYVSTATGNGTTFTPNVATLLAAPQTIWACWHDFNPTAGGAVEVEQNATVTVVTWNNVRNFGGTSTVDDSTWQIQFHAGGEVVFSWQTMAATGNPYLVGYSPGGASSNPGATDLSVALPIVLEPIDIVPLVLTATTRPITGMSWNLTVSQIPPTAVVGFDIGGLTDPGIMDLGFLGMPGCGLRASLDVLAPFAISGATHNISLAIPNNPTLVDQLFYINSGVFTLPALNAFGAITTNGIAGEIGDM